METDPIVQQIIQELRLQPLPFEGGLYHETYRATEQLSAEALPARYREEKPLSTAILYLLTNHPNSFSALHRLPSDEVWHFYLGDPLEMTLLEPGGAHRQVTLGSDVLGGQQVQFVVPRGVWQGTRLAPGGRYALVGTTMAPGYTSADYAGGQRQDLLAQYPQARAQILALTRE